MKTRLPPDFLATAEGAEAGSILRACVHCGFCTATCPTYALLGDELDSPRGRIYLMKSLLEGESAGTDTQRHLDRCLTCRACETTCPSGVAYGHLLDIGRKHIEKITTRPLAEQLLRWLLRKTVPYPQRYAWAWRAGQSLGRLLPERMRPWCGNVQVPSAVKSSIRARRLRRVALLEGCVQCVVTPGVNAAAEKVLAAMEIDVIRLSGCCGALSHHLSAEKEALDLIRANVDRCYQALEQGAEAVISTASGCGVMVKDYGYLLRQDQNYSQLAVRVSLATRDIGEYLAREPVAKLSTLEPKVHQIAFQAPCTLQHGQRLAGVTERLLEDIGFRLTPVADSHLCCGSAGSYSILQPQLARRLGEDKLAKLLGGEPAAIATANIGCSMHLQRRCSLPVRHWLELVSVRNA